MKKKILCTVMIAVLAFSTGCTKEKKEEPGQSPEVTMEAIDVLEGDYYIVEPDLAETGCWTFDKDGYVTMKEYDSYSFLQKGDKTFLNINSEDGKELVRQCLIEKQDKLMELVPAENEKTLSDVPSKSLDLKSGENGLEGTELFDGEYESTDNGGKFTFTKDGKLSIEMSKYQYKFAEGVITLVGSDGSKDFPCTIKEDGNEIDIVMGRELVYKFVKK